jgi:hypothetical protein
MAWGIKTTKGTDMARDSATATATGREIVIGVERPKRAGGAGRPRIPTEFDDLIMGWYQLYLDAEDKDKAWVEIPCTDEEDRRKVGNEVRKAVDYQNDFRTEEDSLGVTRHPMERDGRLYLVVQVHERLERGPKGSANGEVTEQE